MEGKIQKKEGRLEERERGLRKRIEELEGGESGRRKEKWEEGRMGGAKREEKKGEEKKYCDQRGKLEVEQ